MPRSHKGHKCILCIIDEVTNYLITAHMHQTKSDVGDALIENIITKYCIPEYIIMDQDSALMSSLMANLLNKFIIKIKTVAPYNHQSLQAELGSKSISNILTQHLTNLAQMWPRYLSLATVAYNTFNITNLGNHRPYEIIFGRKPRSLLNLESTPDTKVSSSFRQYYNLLNRRLNTSIICS